MEVGRRPNGRYDSEIKFSFVWGFSSVGRPSALQAEGHRFKSDNLHQRAILVMLEKSKNLSAADEVLRTYGVTVLGIGL